MKMHLKIPVTAVAALWAGSALAGVVGGLHDLTSGGPGARDAVAGKSVCEYCHIPHAGGGKRLWAATAPSGSTGTWLGDTNVAALCGSCHYSNVYTAAGILPHIVSNTAYNSLAHKYTRTNLPAQDRTQMDAVRWPYTDKAAIECSSCHNVHDNTVRPFVRTVAGQADVQGNCNGCHNRGNAALAGTANIYNIGGTNMSMHPTRLAYTLDGATGWDINLIGGAGVSTWTAEFANSRGATEAAVPTTPLGGKLLSTEGTTGNMGCSTCHAVHGNEPGTDAASHSTFLTTSENYIEGAAVLTGSTFCEKCHDAAGVLVNNAVAQTQHPVNSVQQNGDARFTAAGVWDGWNATTPYSQTSIVMTSWPEYTAKGGNPGVGCSSCHSAHNGMPGSPMQRTGGNATDWCASCHDLAYAAPLGHHSYKGNLATSLINCVDCHEGGGASQTSPSPATVVAGAASAHRDWLALRNDNYAARADFCLNCHGGMSYDPMGAQAAFTGGALDKNGVVGTNPVANPTNGLTAVLPARHGTAALDGTGGGTHYIGLYKGIAAANVTPRETAWANGAFSAYANAGTIVPAGWVQAGRVTTTGSTKNEIICESCHSVLYNTGAYTATATPTDLGKTPQSGYNNNLLLHPYADDRVGAVATDSLLCVGCHSAGATSAWSTVAAAGALNTLKPAGTHPVTGSVISKVVDSGLGNDGLARANTLLITTQPQTYAQKDNAGGTSATGTGLGSATSVTMPYPAANEMDCDSCHRVHDAATAGTKTGTVTAGGTARHYILEQATAESNQQSMCTVCHTY